MSEPSSQVEAVGDTLAAGIEVADAATRYTLTFRATPSAPRYHVRLSAPPAPDEAIETILSLLDRARNATEHPDARPLASEARQAAQPVALGIALVGAEIEPGRGLVRRLRAVPGWNDVAFAERLAARTDATVRLVRATDAAAVAEARLGAGAGPDADPLLYVLLGRDVSASLIIGGEPLPGAHGAAGRLGHWLVQPEGPRCSCGLRGHLEPLASAQSLVRNAIGRAAASDESTATMLAITGGRAEAMTAPQVVRLARAGDAAAGAVLAEALDALALALANLVAVLDPAVIVLGGPLAAAGEDVLAPLGARLETLCRPFAAAVPALRAGALEPVATLIGARLLATAGSFTVR